MLHIDKHFNSFYAANVKFFLLNCQISLYNVSHLKIVQISSLNFHFVSYKDERKDFKELRKFDNIKSLLNQQTKEEAIIVGKILKTIEKR